LAAVRLDRCWHTERTKGFSYATQGLETKLPQEIARRIREKENMAKIVFGLNQSLDGYVDHRSFAKSRALPSLH